MQNTRPEMRIFQLLRDEDKSGVSGVGLVAVGVVFPSGKVVLEWLGPHSTFGIYNNLTDVEHIHGHGGKSRVVFITQDGQTHMNGASRVYATVFRKEQDQV
jgi:hypothetical protein